MSADEVIISFGDAALRKSDIDTLEQDEWINDAIITFIYEIIDHHLNNDEIGLWPPSVTELLANLPSDQDDIESLLPKMRNNMVLPISDRFLNPKGTSSHWSCLIIQNKRGIHFDSLSPANIDSSQLIYDKLSKVSKLNLVKLKEGEIIHQKNACDCGLYAILIPFHHFMESNNKNVQDSASSITPDKVENFRSILRDWLMKWSNLPSNIKDTIQSYKDIIQHVGPVSYQP